MPAESCDRLHPPALSPLERLHQLRDETPWIVYSQTGSTHNPAPMAPSAGALLMPVGPATQRPVGQPSIIPFRRRGGWGQELGDDLKVTQGQGTPKRGLAPILPLKPCSL